MQGVMSTTEVMCPNKLEDLFAEADQCGVGDKLQDVWYCDRCRECARVKKWCALIFDEVKYVNRLIWNSRGQTSVGVAMENYHPC